MMGADILEDFIDDVLADIPRGVDHITYYREALEAIKESTGRADAETPLEEFAIKYHNLGQS